MILAKILIEEGTEVDVNTTVAIYVEDEADVEAFKDFTIDDLESSDAAPA